MPVYKNCQLTENELKIINLVTEADLQTSSVGETITFKERVKDIKNRYGEDSVITKHIEKVQEIVQL